MSWVTSSIVVPRACQSAQHLVLHPHARERVERAERLVEQQHLGVVHQRPGQGDALGHAAGELVRVGVGERLEADEAEELVHLVALLAEHAAGDQAGSGCCGGR